MKTYDVCASAYRRQYGRTFAVIHVPDETLDLDRWIQRACQLMLLTWGKISVEHMARAFGLKRKHIIRQRIAGRIGMSLRKFICETPAHGVWNLDPSQVQVLTYKTQRPAPTAGIEAARQFARDLAQQKTDQRQAGRSR